MVVADLVPLFLRNTTMTTSPLHARYLFEFPAGLPWPSSIGGDVIVVIVIVVDVDVY